MFTSLLSPLISALSGLAGVILGAVLTSRNQRQERIQRFVLDQLTEFYAPMLGIQERIKGKLRVTTEVADASQKNWRRSIEEAGPWIENVRENQSPKLTKIIEYENQQLKEELIPLYRQMVDLFTVKMHLTEHSTRQHFAALVEFVDLWDRRLRDALPTDPTDVAKLFGASEKDLEALYKDLEVNFEQLQGTLKRGI